MAQEYPFNNPKHDATIQFGPMIILTHAFCHPKHNIYTSIASAAAAAAAIVATSTIAPTAVSTTATAIARVAIAVYRGP